MLNLTENNTIIPDPETLTIPAFKSIWSKDKTKSKEIALKYLAYIYFKLDLKSKYRNSFSGKELDENIKRDLFEDVKYKIPSHVLEAEKIYSKLQTNKYMKLLLASETALETITTYFETFSIDDIEDNKDKAFLIEKLMNNAGKIDDLTLKIETAKKRIQADNEANSLLKKRKLSKWEVPK